VPSGSCSPFPLSLAGEIHELKQELCAVDKSKKKDAVKKVIAAMTVGKDVSPLFPGALRCRVGTGTQPLPLPLGRFIIVT
jgi:AP-1 complex subunit beta-1